MNPQALASKAEDLQQTAESLITHLRDLGSAFRPARSATVAVRQELGSLCQVLKILQEDLGSDAATTLPVEYLDGLSTTVHRCDTTFGQGLILLQSYHTQIRSGTLDWVGKGRGEADALLQDIQNHRADIIKHIDKISE